jgi:hypothetical protein
LRRSCSSKRAAGSGTARPVKRAVHGLPNIARSIKQMKQIARLVLDQTLVRPLGYVKNRLPAGAEISVRRPSVVDEVQHRAVIDSADYAETAMQDALCFLSIWDFWDHAAAARNIAGLNVEFGVWKATSTNHLAKRIDGLIHGFDSFEGLKEDWRGWGYAKGHFSLGGELPAVAANVRLHKGWFDQTLPPFLAANDGPFAFAHIDCDTYESTRIILEAAHDRFVKGTVLMFDEYFGYRGWRLGEFKAWQEFVAAQAITYRYLAFHDQAVSVVIT